MRPSPGPQPVEPGKRKAPVQQRPGQAQAEFERSLERQPDRPQTLFNMGVLLLENRNDTEGTLE